MMTSILPLKILACNIQPIYETNTKMNHTEHPAQLSMKIPDQTRWAEIIAVVLTGLGKFILMDGFNYRFLYITLACVGWAAYIIYRSKRSPWILAYWGFKQEHFKSTFLQLLPYALVAVAGFIIYGLQTGSIIISWHIIPIFIIYPIWGIIQQFLIVALVGGNLHDMSNIRLSPWVIIPVTAVIFAGVHYPFPVLIGGTFILALIYTYVYLKKKNLWVLGLYHGWLGAIFFYTVLSRDAWLELFTRIST